MEEEGRGLRASSYELRASFRSFARNSRLTAERAGRPFLYHLSFVAQRLDGIQIGRSRCGNHGAQHADEQEHEC